MGDHPRAGLTRVDIVSGSQGTYTYAELPALESRPCDEVHKELKGEAGGPGVLPLTPAPGSSSEASEDDDIMREVLEAAKREAEEQERLRKEGTAWRTWGGC